METSKDLRPDYLFEVSWEVCNKVGGIHTVITSKVLTAVREWQEQYILVGPDIWRGQGEHPEFREDQGLFSTLKQKIEEKGLKVRIGRWKIPGSPVVILVDHTSLFSSKDEIFRELWLNFQVDSLRGGWDYIEPALFGYAAGKVIECFYQCHFSFSDLIVAHFHEWLTAAGVLYLERTVPQIATVFTTHATVLGRALAGNEQPFYSGLQNFDPAAEAKKWKLTSKHSLEKAGAQYADCFTTVSSMTAKECVQFLDKQPDVITINGFDNTIVPVSYQLKQKRSLARRKLLRVARALTGGDVPDDSLLLLKSGRYEFRNKGIDLFIEALAAIRDEHQERQVIGFIFVPAHHTGPIAEVSSALEGKGEAGMLPERILTHHLQGRESDKILQHILKYHLENRPGDKVKLIFAPVYLDGRDGIFDLHYYELLPGFDLAVFPSYYEPWGYTPLESLSFHVPSVTTDVAGFGQFMQSAGEGLSIVHREDRNEPEVVRELTAIMARFREYSEADLGRLRQAAYELSRRADWRILIRNYEEAYALALEKTEKRHDLFEHEPRVLPVQHEGPSFPLSNAPVRRKLLVKPVLPPELWDLEELSQNLWWSWNSRAVSLLERTDRELWSQTRGNPVAVLNRISYERIQELTQDPDFREELKSVVTEFRTYVSRPTAKAPCVAYFCMEFGLESFLKIYSGGLGILAGDYLKEASDQGMPLFGVGLLYRNGYFRQKLSVGGDQIPEEDLQHFTDLPLKPLRDAEGNWIVINIGLPGRSLFAKAWQVSIGKTSLFLLDTDIAENHLKDRTITSQLYTSDPELRLKQELVLGIGGVRLLNFLDLRPRVFHCNEGHAAFLGLERIYKRVVEENLSFPEALELVRASTLFTTHTPLRAGTDLFSEDLLRRYLWHYPDALNITWEELMALGQAGDRQQPFSMSDLAGRVSQEINGVSRLNSRVSRSLYQHLWKGFTPEELPLGHVNNAVHTDTWASREWKQLFSELNISPHQLTEKEAWSRIAEVAPQRLWDVHHKAKRRLVKRLQEIPGLKDQEAGSRLSELLERPGEDFLLLGFARRFALYKRPTLLFSDLSRLEKLLWNEERPVVLVLAGKAHPADREAQKLLKEVLRLRSHSEISGRMIFLEDYGMDLAREMLQGVDLWLNTPVRGLEASGTSGMKAVFNGVLNFSTLDGWWEEAYEDSLGWALPDNPFKEELHMNEFDAGELYRILETEIIPAYFERVKGLPLRWIAKMKHALKQLGPLYNTRRMLEEYYHKYYDKLVPRSELLSENNFEKLKALVSWKQEVTKKWPLIKVNRLVINDSARIPVALGSSFTVEVEIDLAGLSPEDISLELLLFEKRDNPTEKIFLKRELQVTGHKPTGYFYKLDLRMSFPGVYYHYLRIHPSNPLLANSCDFPVITYL